MRKFAKTKGRGRLNRVLRLVAREAAHEAVAGNAGNKRAAARELGISPATLYKLLKGG